MVQHTIILLVRAPFFLKKKSGPQTTYTPTSTAPRHAAAAAMVDVLYTLAERSMLYNFLAENLDF